MPKVTARKITASKITARKITASPIASGIREWISLLTGATLTRAGGGTYWDDTGTLQTAGTDVLRQDHDPATGAYRGALVEEGATNVVFYSDDLNNAAWVKDNVSVSNDGAAAPNGTVSADKIVEDTSSGLHRILDTFPGDQTDPWTLTLYAQAAGRHKIRPQLDASSDVDAEAIATFDLDTQAITASVSGPDTSGLETEIADVGNGYYMVRLTVSQLNNTDDGVLTNRIYLVDNAGNVSYAGDGSSGLLVWGVNLVNQAYASSPIKTAGSSTTRPDDVLTKPFSESSGTIHLVGEHIGGDGVLWQADNTTENSRMRVDVSSGNVRLVVDDGGVNQATLTAGALASNGKYDLAFRFAPNDFAISLDGATAVTDTTATIPTVTTGRFGADTSGPTGRNWYKTSDYRTALLSDSQLEALTA